MHVDVGNRWAAIAMLMLVACSSARAQPVPIQAGSWTLAVLPDTQVYAQSYPGIFDAQAQFLADIKESHNLAFVLQEGDFTNRNITQQWTVGSTSFRILDDAGISYAIAPGNHDFGPGGNGSTRDSLFENFFPLTRLQNQTTFGGVYPGTDGSEANLPNNSYHTFNAGGQDWLALALEFGPRDEVMQWADGIIKTHPDHLAMIVTHAYLYSDSTRYDWATKGSRQTWNPHSYGVARRRGGVNDGEEMWQELKDNQNLKLVFSGHVLNDGTGYLASVGDNGNVVHEILANYQFLPNGGQGYMRLLEFLPDGDTVEVRTYSPWLDAQGRDPQRIEPDQQFTMSLSTVPPPPPPPPIFDYAIGGNIVVTGRVDPPGNTVDSVAVPQSAVPGVGTLRVERGDYEIAINGQGLHFGDGVLLASVTENERDGMRATVEVSRDTFGDDVLTLSVMEAGKRNNNELNVNTAVAWFMFDAGWRGAHVNARGTIAAGNDVQRDMLTRTDVGRYQLDLDVNSRDDGMLFAIGNNDNNLVVQTGVLGDGDGWDIRVHDNSLDFGPRGLRADFSFLYLPFDTENLIGGRYDGIAGTHLASVGDFIMENLGTGQYKLTIPGETPDTGMLVLTASRELTSGLVTAPDDNMLSYQDDSQGNFLIQSHDLPGITLEDTEFVWAFVSFTDPIKLRPVPEPASFVLMLLGWLAMLTVFREKERAGRNLQ